MLSQPKCSAVSDDEHIVSTAMLGPVKFIKYDTLLAIAENEEATGTLVFLSSPSNSSYMLYITPTKTPTLLLPSAALV